MDEMIKMDFYVCKRLIRECNAKDLQKAWKKFLRTQNEKEKIKKENKKVGKENRLVSQADDW